MPAPESNLPQPVVPPTFAQQRCRLAHELHGHSAVDHGGLAAECDPCHARAHQALAALGAAGWQAMPAEQLYRNVRLLRAYGNDGEARNESWEMADLIEGAVPPPDGTIVEPLAMVAVKPLTPEMYEPIARALFTPPLPGTAAGARRQLAEELRKAGLAIVTIR